jgi:hypothetical protein
VQSVNFKDEEGSAVLEFIGFGLLVQIPLILFASNLVSVQQDQFAAEAITRDALRSFVLLDREPSEGAVELAEAYRVSPSRITVTMTCRPTDCRQEGTWVYVQTHIGNASASGVIQR